MNGSRRDLTGRVFDRLTVLRALPRRRDQKTRWVCRCACGQQTTVRVDHLLAGQTRSCGCLWRRDLRGQQVGHLRVLQRAPNVPRRSRHLAKGHTAWVCQCRCSRVIVVTTASLTNVGHPTTHCGCEHLKPSMAQPPTDSTLTPVEVPECITTAQQALNRFHDEQSPLGRVRRVCRPVEEDDKTWGVLHDGDPFA